MDLPNCTGVDIFSYFEGYIIYIYIYNGVGIRWTSDIGVGGHNVKVAKCSTQEDDIGVVDVLPLHNSKKNIKACPRRYTKYDYD